MITLNSKKFAETEKEFINSLFEIGGTCVGYAIERKDRIVLTDHNKNRIGVITKHRVLALATKQDNGKYWYSHGDINIIGKYGSYANQVKDIDCALTKCNINH